MPNQIACLFNLNKGEMMPMEFVNDMFLIIRQ